MLAFYLDFLRAARIFHRGLTIESSPGSHSLETFPHPANREDDVLRPTYDPHRRYRIPPNRLEVEAKCESLLVVEDVCRFRANCSGDAKNAESLEWPWIIKEHKLKYLLFNFQRECSKPSACVEVRHDRLRFECFFLRVAIFEALRKQQISDRNVRSVNLGNNQHLPPHNLQLLTCCTCCSLVRGCNCRTW